VAEAVDAGGGSEVEDDPVTEPSVPRGATASPGEVERPPEAPVVVSPEPAAADVEEDPVTEPSTPRPGTIPDRPAETTVHRLLAVLVDDPSEALAGVAALERGEEPGRAAVTLLRSGVPAPAVARLCGVEAEDLGDLVASALGVLRASEQTVSL
jgi:hypothetical protein